MFSTMLSLAILTTHWIGFLASFFVLYVLGLFVYRLTLHPLAKYPGPFLARISDLNNFYHVWLEDRHVYLMKCHEKYGPVYRHGPNRLSFNTSHALHSIHGFKANVKKSSYYSAFENGIISTFSIVDKVRHGQRRRIIAHAFSERALKGVEEGFLKNIRTWCERLGEIGGKGSSGLDMSQWCTYLTYDVMGDLAFGRSFDLLTIPQNRNVLRNLKHYMTMGNLNGNMLWAFRCKASSLFFPSVSSGSDSFGVYFTAQAEERVQLGTERLDTKDFFYYLISAKDPETGVGLTMNELSGESMSIIIAGTDTTSTTLAGTFFYLTHNPKVLETVKREVRTIFEGCGVEDVVSGSKLNACVYLRACLEETLRMAPPVPGNLPREVCAGGAVIDGVFVPAGVDVSTSIYSIHHNAEYFPEPYTYRPERWIIRNPIQAERDSKGRALYDGVPRKEVEVAQKAFCAFSIGPRGCVGKNMAYMEMMLAMARVLLLFDIELAGTLGGEERDGHVGFELKDIFTANNQGPLIRFLERKK